MQLYGQPKEIDMYHSIKREEIQQLLASKAAVTLIEALPQGYYDKGHLPGAINIPHDKVRERAPSMLPDKSAFIIVYCANTPCQNSAIAARTLDALGYTNVAEYVEGKQDWVEAGLPLESWRTEKAA
jgi:rhodanese-related sulfurtransferase